MPFKAQKSPASLDDTRGENWRFFVFKSPRLSIGDRIVSRLAAEFEESPQNKTDAAGQYQKAHRLRHRSQSEIGKCDFAVVEGTFRPKPNFLIAGPPIRGREPNHP